MSSQLQDEPGEYKGTHQPTSRSPFNHSTWQSPEPALALVEEKSPPFLSHPQ